MHLLIAFINVSYGLHYATVLLVYQCLVDMDCITQGHV